MKVAAILFLAVVALADASITKIIPNNLDNTQDFTADSETFSDIADPEHDNGDNDYDLGIDQIHEDETRGHLQRCGNRCLKKKLRNCRRRNKGVSNSGGQLPKIHHRPHKKGGSKGGCKHCPCDAPKCDETCTATQTCRKQTCRKHPTCDVPCTSGQQKCINTPSKNNPRKQVARCVDCAKLKCGELSVDCESSEDCDPDMCKTASQYFQCKRCKGCDIVFYQSERFCKRCKGCE